MSKEHNIEKILGDINSQVLMWHHSSNERIDRLCKDINDRCDWMKMGVRVCFCAYLVLSIPVLILLYEVFKRYQ